MLELAHRLPVDLRLSTAGPRSGLPPPRQHGPAWMQIYSRIGIWGDWNIWFFTQPIIAPVLFFQQTFPPLPIEFSWTLVARPSLKNSSMLVLLLSALCSGMSSFTLQPFSALQCKRSRMEDGWLNDGQGVDFLLAWSIVCSFPLTSSPHLSVVLMLICMQPVVSVNSSEAYSPLL